MVSAGPYASLHHAPDNHASTPPLSFFTDRMPFLPPNQQRQSTEGQTILSEWSTYAVHLYMLQMLYNCCQAVQFSKQLIWKANVNYKIK